MPRAGDIVSTTVRWEKDFGERAKRLAEKHHRSLNEEIKALVEAAIQEDDRLNHEVSYPTRP